MLNTMGTRSILNKRFRPLPLYAGKIIGKCSFISAIVRPVALTDAFRQPEEFEDAGCRVGTETILKTKLFVNDDVTIIARVYSLDGRVFRKHNSKLKSVCSVFKFRRRSVNGKHLMRF